MEEESLQPVQENNQLKMKQSPPPLKQDLKPDATVTALLSVLQAAKPEPTTKGQFSVYVGEYDEVKRSFRNPPNFDVTSPPAVNATVTTVQPVYERDAKPYQDDKKNWQLGAIRGVLGKGKLATVLETATIGENAHDFNSWIKIKPECSCI